MKEIITLDAGHFSKYNRSPVNSEYYESDFTWKITESLASKLVQSGLKVIKTRQDKNKDLALLQRGKLSKGSDLFISLHSNACATESVDRVEAIVLSDNANTSIDNISNDIGTKLAFACKECIGVSSYKVYSRRSANDRDKNGILDDEYYGVLEGAREVGTPALILECGFHTNRKTTEWLLNDNNIEKLATCLANEIISYFKIENNKITESTNKVDDNNSIIEPIAFSESDIFNFFIKEAGFTSESTCALIGTIQAESGLSAINLQNSFNKKLNLTDKEYTEAVDKGDYTNFVHDSAGYGLCQWTFWSRKQGLLDYTSIHNSRSVGDSRSQCEYIVLELKNNYKNLYSLLKTSKNIEETSRALLVEYERPAVVVNNPLNSVLVQTEFNKRLTYANEAYSRLSTKAETPSETPSETPEQQVVNKDEGIISMNDLAVNHSLPMTVKIINNNTPVFKGIETNDEIVATVNSGEIYTVVEEVYNLLKLKSGIGYIREKDIQIYDIQKQSNPYSVPTRTLKYGCIGEDVQWLKFELLQYGLGTFDHNNKNFYDQVKNAVMQYQKIMGLEVDGIVGINTRNSLINDGF